MSEPSGPPFSVAVERLFDFDSVIDVRSPAEFAEDHVPGAVNCPVLDDVERALVGTMYARESPFAARRMGAALVARNIARHLDFAFAEYPRQWKPLVYCWRGGQRSGAMVIVLAQVGWAARQLEGGYRSYRRRVIDDLAGLPARFSFVVLHGPTGSGKTALLEALQECGAQVLNLEAHAHHRGSVLGGASALAQPGQKAFETRIWHALRSFDSGRPVYVESESRRIGQRDIPNALFEAMTGSACLRIAASVEARVAHLLERYSDIYRDPQELHRRMDFFIALHGRNTVEQWRKWIDAARWADLASAMVRTHYDPAYRRGGDSLYRRAHSAQVLGMNTLDRDAILRAAQSILQTTGTRNAE